MTVGADADRIPVAHDALWISRTGELACIHHVPHPPAEACDTGLWRRLTRADTDEIEKELAREPSCEACDAIEQHEEWRASRGA